MRKVVLIPLLSFSLFASSLGEKLDYLFQKRKTLSQQFVKATSDLDSYISGDYYGFFPYEGNYLDVTLSLQIKGNEVKIKPSMKARIDLPKTKKKMQLILTEHDEEITHQDIQQEYGEKRKKYGTLLGIKYFLKNRLFASTSFSAGVKLGSPVDFYTRAKLIKTVKLNRDWQMIGEQKFYLFSHRGFQSFTTLNFDKKIDKDFMFRVSNNLIYKNKEDSFEIAHSLMLFHHLTKQDDFIYSATVAGLSKNLNKSTPKVSTYEFKTVYRHTMSNKWLYFDIIPAVNWDREHHFKPNYSLNLNISVIFGKYDIY